MSNTVIDTSEIFFAETELDKFQLQLTLESMMSPNVDFAEMYFQSSRHESWMLEDGIVKDASFSSDKGVGIRALSGEKTGFAYSEEISLPALQQSAKASKSIAKMGASKNVKLANSLSYKPRYKDNDPLMSLTEAEKISILQRLDKLARQMEPKVREVIASLSGVYEQILVCASDGTFSSDIRPLVRANVTVIID